MMSREVEVLDNFRNYGEKTRILAQGEGRYAGLSVP
jgi:hypothetical protein